jgi:DNA-binding transcriptional ArsR family regulator
MSLQATLRALADPVRREILHLLKAGPLAAGELGTHFDISAAAVSKHLNVLKEADLVLDERQGKFIIYRLNASVLEEILLWLKDLKGEGNYD